MCVCVCLFLHFFLLPYCSVSHLLSVSFRSDGSAASSVVDCNAGPEAVTMSDTCYSLFVVYINLQVWPGALYNHRGSTLN